MSRGTARFMEPGSPQKVFAVVAALLLIACVPLALTLIPPLSDYPNHVARIYVLLNLDHSAELATYYAPFLRPIPNLAFDAVALVLAQMLPLWLAGKVVIAITFAVMLGGVIYLHRVVHGHWSVWPCLAIFFLYNRLFLWGFVGNLLSLGLAIWGTAVFLQLRHARPVLRLAVNSALALIIYFGHLFALGIYAITIACLAAYDLLPRIRREPGAVLRELFLLGLPFGAPALLFLFSPTAEVLGKTEWKGLLRSLSTPFNVVNNYNHVLDITTFLLLGALVVVAFLHKRLKVAPEFIGVLVVLGLLALAMPDQLMSIYFADQRIPIALALLGVAATDPVIRPKDGSALIFAVFAVLFIVRIGVISDVWRKSDQVYKSYIAAFEHMPRGARLLSIVSFPGDFSLPPIPCIEAGTIAVITRDAFAPNLYAYPLDPGKPIRFSPAFHDLVLRTPEKKYDRAVLEALKDPAYANRKSPFRPEILSAYDYFLMVNPELFTLPVPDSLTPVFKGVNFVLLKRTK